MIPVVIRTTENMLLLVPASLREAAYALGTPKWRVITMVTLRAARAGVITGCCWLWHALRARQRLCCLHALNNQFWNADLSKPMASLPVTIFKFAMSPYENWQQLAWAGVFLITVAVLGLNILARVLTRQNKINKEDIHALHHPSIRPANAKITVRDLNFYYGKFHALKNINLDIPEKRSRPSSAHRAAASPPAAYVQPHVRAVPRAARRRPILLDGENLLTSKQDVALVRAKVGMVFQSPRRSPCPSTTTSRLA